MINNRQGGRRRGRGGQRPPNIGGGQPGNRQDNRQRGNAAQLLEKYKNMARDAQLGGDRVQSEYYLQFAEHYHRVLGESRARFEEQRRQRGDDGGSDDDGDDEMLEGADEQAEQQEQSEQRDQRERRPQREQRPRRSESRSNGSRHESDNDDDERIALEVLPPSIGRDTDGDEDAEPAAKPRRRTRRPRSEDSEDEIAPAA